MASASRSLRRTCLTWMRVVLPPYWVLAAFAVVLAGLELIAHTMLRGTANWGAGVRELELLAHAPRDGWLACALMLYGAFHVLGKHPLYRPAYAEWLARTPWHGQLALPLGPVHLVPQDGLILLAAWLVSLHDSRFNFHAVVALFAVPYLIELAVALRATGERAHAYLLGYGLATAVWLGLPSLTATLLLILLYGIGWHGLPNSLERVATNDSPRLREALRSLSIVKPSASQARRKIVGFPLAQLGPQVDYAAIPMGESLLLAWLPAAWLYAAVGRSANAEERVAVAYTLAQSVVLVAALARLKVYCSEYRPPITLAGRLKTRRWLIPGYDRVWLPMACALGVILAIDFLFFEGVRQYELGPLALGLSLSMLLAMPPRLSDWALTGQHRIVADPWARTEFVEI